MAEIMQAVGITDHLPGHPKLGCPRHLKVRNSKYQIQQKRDKMQSVDPAKPVVVAQYPPDIKKQQRAHQKMYGCKMPKSDGQPKNRLPIYKKIVIDKDDCDGSDRSRKIKGMGLDPPVMIKVD